MKVIAVLFIIFGALGVIGAFFSTLIFGSLAGMIGLSGEEGAPAGAAALGAITALVTGLILLVSVPNIICGIGLLQLRRWARILGIVLAIISLLQIPFGTIFGVYALIVLFHKDTEALFGGGAPATLPSTVDRA